MSGTTTRRRPRAQATLDAPPTAADAVLLALAKDQDALIRQWAAAMLRGEVAEGTPPTLSDHQSRDLDVESS